MFWTGMWGLGILPLAFQTAVLVDQVFGDTPAMVPFLMAAFALGWIAWVFRRWDRLLAAAPMAKRERFQFSMQEALLALLVAAVAFGAARATSHAILRGQL